MAVSIGLLYLVVSTTVRKPVALPVLASPLSLPATSPQFSSLVAALNADSAVAQRVRRIVLLSNPALRHTALTDYGILQPSVVQWVMRVKNGSLGFLNVYYGVDLHLG